MSVVQPDIQPTAASRAMSEAEFFCLGEEIHAEWVEGVAYFMSPVTLDHDHVQGWLKWMVELLVSVKDLGVVHSEPFTLKLAGQERLRQPDVMFIATGNAGQHEQLMFVGAPDLVIEVVSRDSIRRDYMSKRQEYERAGVKEYLIVDPLSRDASLLRLSPEGKFYDVAPVNGRLVSTVLEGFFFEPAWLASLPLPSRHKVAKAMGVRVELE